MTAPDPKAAARRRKTMRAVNVPMRAVLSLPFRTPLGSRLMLLHYTGRKSGKQYRQPISYVADGDVLLTPGGGNWTYSLADGEPVTVRIAGKDVTLRPELVSDPTEVDTLLQRMAKLNPALLKFVPLPRNEDGSFQAEPLGAALAHGFRIVRWHKQAL
jgi:deazaflavin-dependent oxidoreductase (nitroreductase family)